MILKVKAIEGALNRNLLHLCRGDPQSIAYSIRLNKLVYDANGLYKQLSVGRNVEDDTVTTVRQYTRYWFVNVRPTGLFSENVNGNRYALSSGKNYNQLYRNNF